jgi:hypothetical protein
MTLRWTNRIGVYSMCLIAAVATTMTVASEATAGPLATSNFALNDGFGPDAGRWHGSANVMGAAFGDTLNAQVDWAVFAPGKFQLFLNSQGIAQVDPSGPNELIYVYQITSVTDALPGIDALTVGIDSSDGRGMVSAPAFVLTGAPSEKSPSSGGDNTTSMAWFFNGAELDPGDISSLLVFTSPFSPEYDFLSVNSGLAGPPVSPLVPSPSDRRFVAEVPEPSSLLLGLLGFAALLGCRREALHSRRT